MAGVQFNVIPQTGPSRLLALVTPPKAGFKLQLPVPVALATPL
jgi:hypothetical protein